MTDHPAATTTHPARCHLTWHLTSRCNRTCSHCLREVPGQANRDLQGDDCRRLLDSFIDFANASGRQASIEFSGGNPLLHKDFPELLQRAHAARVDGPVTQLRLLANPETMDEATIGLLRACALDHVWISLDGMEAANDRMRGSGSFKIATRAIRDLVAAGIPTSVKYTMVRDNAQDFPAVVAMALDLGVRQVGLGPLILAGGGFHERERALTPVEYRQVLLDLLPALDLLPERHQWFRRSFLSSNRMYALLFHELGRHGEYSELCAERGLRESRGDGGALFVVWSDGEVVLRREMQRQGWAPRDSFQQIYDGSYLVKLLEDRAGVQRAAMQAQADHVRCSTCPVAAQCPPAMVGTFGARLLFAPSELCWRLHPGS